MDLEEFLMSKALEGKASKTVKQYRYELVRLLTYINKPESAVFFGCEEHRFWRYFWIHAGL